MAISLDKKEICQYEITVSGKTYKVNEPLFNEQICGKNYELIIPTVFKDSDDVMRAALICYPKYNKVGNELLIDTNEEIFPFYIEE